MTGSLCVTVSLRVFMGCENDYSVSNIRVKLSVHPCAVCWQGATHCFCNSSMRFLREMTWKQHMSVFKPARSYLNHRILGCDSCPLPSSADKHTQIILAWCSGLAGIKQHCVGKSQACVFCVLPQQDGIELDQSHTLTWGRNHLGMCKIRCLLTLPTIFI